LARSESAIADSDHAQSGGRLRELVERALEIGADPGDSTDERFRWILLGTRAPVISFAR